MEISLVAGLVRTALITWLCLVMIPRRLRRMKAMEDKLGKDSPEVQEMSLAALLQDADVASTLDARHRYRVVECDFQLLCHRVRLSVSTLCD